MEVAVRFVIRKNASGQYWWRLWRGSRIIADSGETYVNKSDLKAMIEWIKSNAKNVPVVDETGETTRSW